MILAVLFLPILLVSANPFHKYPYVFLLDIGNEELEKVNTEQIRLSSPGGSVALRYPAIGNGDDIAHVRVSGIDFGTDLKANVLDGGPGYKYVVIVLMGKPGVSFDAVITIQTVPTIPIDNIQAIDNNSNGYVKEDISRTNQLSENDPNNSAEDLKDYEEEPSQVGVNEKNGELTQESSNVYSYEQNEALSGYGSEHNDENSENDEDDDDSEGDDDINNKNSNQSENVELEDYDPREDDLNIEQPTAGRYNTDEYSQSERNSVIVDQNLYNKYLVLQEYLNDGSAVQSNSAYVDQNDDYRPVNVDVYDDYEDNDLGKYRDANNNFIDTDETSAVEQ